MNRGNQQVEFDSVGQQISNPVAPPRVARRWVRGQRPLPGQDEQAFRTDVSDDERQAMREVHLRALLHDVQGLVTATIREDRNAMAAYIKALAPVTLKCLAKSPEDRYQTADELRVALDEILRNAQTLTLTADQPPKNADEEGTPPDE